MLHHSRLEIKNNNFKKADKIQFILVKSKLKNIVNN